MSLLPPEIYERIIADALHLEQLPYRAIMSNVFTQIRESNHTFSGRCGRCRTDIHDIINEITNEVTGNTLYDLGDDIVMINNYYDHNHELAIDRVRIFCGECIPYWYGVY